MRQRLVERRDARPVGLLGLVRLRVAGGDRALHDVRADRGPDPLGAQERGEPAAR